MALLLSNWSFTQTPALTCAPFYRSDILRLVSNGNLSWQRVWLTAATAADSSVLLDLALTETSVICITVSDVWTRAVCFLCLCVTQSSWMCLSCLLFWRDGSVCLMPITLTSVNSNRSMYVRGKAFPNKSACPQATSTGQILKDASKEVFCQFGRVWFNVV